MLTLLLADRRASHPSVHTSRPCERDQCTRTTFPGPAQLTAQSCTTQGLLATCCWGSVPLNQPRSLRIAARDVRACTLWNQVIHRGSRQAQCPRARQLRVGARRRLTSLAGSPSEVRAGACEEARVGCVVHVHCCNWSPCRTRTMTHTRPCGVGSRHVAEGLAQALVCAAGQPAALLEDAQRTSRVSFGGAGSWAGAWVAPLLPPPPCVVWQSSCVLLVWDCCGGTREVLGLTVASRV